MRTVPMHDELCASTIGKTSACGLIATDGYLDNTCVRHVPSYTTRTFTRAKPSLSYTIKAVSDLWLENKYYFA